MFLFFCHSWIVPQRGHRLPRPTRVFNRSGGIKTDHKIHLQRAVSSEVGPPFAPKVVVRNSSRLKNQLGPTIRTLSDRMRNSTRIGFQIRHRKMSNICFGQQASACILPRQK